MQVGHLAFKLHGCSKCGARTIARALKVERGRAQVAAQQRAGAAARAAKVLVAVVGQLVGGPARGRCLRCRACCSARSPCHCASAADTAERASARTHECVRRQNCSAVAYRQTSIQQCLGPMR